MEVFYADASNPFISTQKRLIRVVYGQTQATPYAAVLDPGLRNSEGEIIVPKESEVIGHQASREKTVFSLRNSIVPGTVLVKTEGEYVSIAGAKKEVNERPFGLLGQWVGGTFDGLKGTNQVSAWMGFDSVLDLLAPAFNTTSKAVGTETLSNAFTVSNENPGTEKGRVLLYADNNGLLSPINQEELSTKKVVPVAEGIEYNGAVLRIKLLV